MKQKRLQSNIHIKIQTTYQINQITNEEDPIVPLASLLVYKYKVQNFAVPTYRRHIEKQTNKANSLVSKNISIEFDVACQVKELAF